ncbi:MAG: hypothetical protein KGS60_05570 [Verrucomicrobia bacterium]|nr:hypothetical protein [Verrucomicrobiota bacterium]
MNKPDPAIHAAKELSLLLRCYPEVSLEALGTALQSTNPPPAPSGDSWEHQVAAIRACAAAFGNKRFFASKQAALAILSEELGIPGHWTRPAWSQMPEIAAAALLRHGPAKAEELMRRYHLTPAAPPPGRRKPKLHETVAATIGIFKANHT